MKKLNWELRNLFWREYTLLKYRNNKRRHIPRPRDNARQIQRIPLSQRYPDIPISNISVADHVPADENNRLLLAACKVQAYLYRFFPPKVADLPSISSDPAKAIARAYGPRYSKYFPVPALPKEYKDDIDLGSLAVAGPYFCHLQATKKGEPYPYEWDLEFLGGYERHPDLRSLGVRVFFKVDVKERRLRAVEISCELGECTPNHPQWELATKIALCAATTHLSLVRHFNGVHLALVSQFSIATRNILPANHCLRRLLWPHVWGTQFSNEAVTEILMMKGGDFEEIFSFTHAGLCKLFSDTYDQYKIDVIDPSLEAKLRGVCTGDFDTPALDNRLAYWELINRHTCHYLKKYYSSDDELMADSAVQEWIAELNRIVPGGVNAILEGGITVKGVAKLAAGYIYTSTVEHEVLGSKLWDYQLWTHVQPIRIYEDERREPVDVYQRLVNNNFIVNVRRLSLLQDFSYLAGNDRAGAAAFSLFLQELAALQVSLKDEPYECWKVYPTDLEVSVNG